MIIKADAVLALRPEGGFKVDENGTVTYLIPNQTEPTEKQIQAKLAELQAEYDSKKYQRDRLTEYPSIQELVVALYDEEDKASIIERRKAVKAKYPKPE